MFVDVFNELLDEAELNRKQFAEKCGIPYTTVVGWTTLNRLPDFTSLIKIADFFNCSIDYLAQRQTESDDFKYLSASQKQLLTNFESLDSENRQLIYKLIEKLTK